MGKSLKNIGLGLLTAGAYTQKKKKKKAMAQQQQYQQLALQQQQQAIEFQKQQAQQQQELQQQQLALQEREQEASNQRFNQYNKGTSNYQRKPNSINATDLTKGKADSGQTISLNLTGDDDETDEWY